MLSESVTFTEPLRVDHKFTPLPEPRARPLTSTRKSTGCKPLSHSSGDRARGGGSLTGGASARKPEFQDRAIWIGGDTPAALRRVAELGDGWHPAFPTPQSLGEALPRLRDACRRAGRDMASVTISGRVGLAARRSADELLAELKALRDLGVSHVILESRARDLGEMAELYEKFARDVRPRL